MTAATQFLLGDCPTLIHSACASLLAVEDAICGEKVAICKRMWCTGHRMCHRPCMLRVWHKQTGDPRFQERAERCGGRCGAWDLVSSQVAGAELWHGHWFVPNSEVDRSRLGLHHSQCPLRDDRNTMDAHTRVTCASFVLDNKKRAYLRKCRSRLQQMEQCKMSRFKMALEVECMKSVVADEHWIPPVCGTEHVVDPWSIRPISVVCPRQRTNRGSREAVRDLLKELQSLLEFFAAQAILDGLFEDKHPPGKTLGTLPVNVPAKAQDLAQPMDVDSEPQEAAEVKEDQNDGETVLQTVHHLEPAADIPEDEAQMIVDIQQADFVQRILGAAPLQVELNHEPELEVCDELIEEDIFKGRVNRMSKDTYLQFLEGATLRPCRDALTGEGYEVQIRGGCLVFVRPHQYEDVLRALQTFALTRADIVFAASFEYLVEQTLSDAFEVGCKGSWMKTRDQLPMEIETEGEQKEESMEVDGILEIDRTFYRWRPATAAASNPKPLTF